MTKWLRAKQNVESWLIIPNIISIFERDILEFTTREAQSRNSFQIQNQMACIQWKDVRWCDSLDKRGTIESEVILYWNIDHFTSLL